MKTVVETFDCPRCGKRHEQKFAPLTRPAGPWTHWGTCRETREPVLMMSKPMSIWEFIRFAGQSGMLRVARGTPPAPVPAHGPDDTPGTR